MGWREFEWDPENLPGLKLGLHIAQIVFAFVAFALGISVFKDAKASIVGDNGWAFGVVRSPALSYTLYTYTQSLTSRKQCFLSLPAWIYLCMAPRFPRTRKLAQPHAMAVVDGVFAIFWLSAFAAQAAYNSGNLCGGACGQSKAIVAMGFFVLFVFTSLPPQTPPQSGVLTLWVNSLLFCGTTFLSIYTVKFYEWNGRLPGYDKGITNQNIDPDKAAFSMAPHDEEAYSHVPMNDHDHDGAAHDPYAAGSGTEPYGSHAGSSYAGAGGSAYDDTSYVGAGRTASHGSRSSYAGASGVQDNPFGQKNPFDDDHGEYATSHQNTSNAGRPYAPPTAEEYDDDRPAQFPAANYDRVVR
jgi:hypothetical protein